MRRAALRMWPLVLGWMVAAGQELPDSGWVRITTDPASATVFVDGRLAGTSPVDSLRLPPGAHVIQAQRQSPYRWTTIIAAESVEVRAGTGTAVHVYVPAEVFVRTEPAGAFVEDGGVVLGRTPLRVSEDRVASILLSFEGRSLPLRGAPDSGGVVMQRFDVTDPTPEPTVMTGPGASGLRSEVWTLTAGGTMVVSGVLAAVFRDRANSAAEAYQRTRDPQSLADVRRYDRLAGASMAVVQVSLGAFVALLTGL
ncbi:MAG: PEGA domain-containing protein [Bacteroidota bacterium]